MIKKNLNKILYLINSIALLILLISYLTSYIHPDYFWQISLLGLFFPVVLIINILFSVFWIVSWKKYFWANFIIIIIGLSHVNNIIGNQTNKFDKKVFGELSKNKTHTFDQLINVMSYNVRLFNHNQNLANDSIEKEIIDFVKEEKPNILCIQEFKDSDKTLDIYRFFNKRKKTNNRLQIITKYNEINHGFVHNMNSCIYTDIILNDTLRIYNIHLQSNWIKTMKLSYQTRANEAVIIKKHIDNSPYPVIVCGDFNDTPISYTYTKISQKLSDAFKESGIGIGSSYIGVPFLRIDYILHDKKYKSYSYKKHKKKLSDHYPISSNILIP
jgi:endonuclease/exonuclease/phosphatase family metal-dependent hydrolase